jgi:hypothetical protein
MTATTNAPACEKKCGTCACWNRIGHSIFQRKIVQDDRVEIVPTGNIGHCRAGRPLEDFKWPRTHEDQVCGEWRPSSGEGARPGGAAGDSGGDGDNFSLQHGAAGESKKPTKGKRT